MSTNRNAQLRYQVLDNCLSNRGRKWTWKDLLEKVNEKLKEDNPNSKGIGKTQLYEDLKDIEYRVYKSDIEKFKEGRTSYLRYTDKNFSISNSPLNETEVSQLKSAVQVLSRFKGMPQFEWVNETIPVLQKKFGLIESKNEVISFDTNSDYEGMIHITPIFNAIINKRVLKLTYQDFKSPVEYEKEFHPYYLKQYNSRWFSFGYNPTVTKYEVETIALDRIKGIEECNSKYVSKNIDWEDYVSDFVGVSKGKGESVEVKLLILDAEQAAYIKTKPLHQTQKQIKQVENGFETSINVIPNYELETLILSYGERIKVLSPKSFQKKIAERLKDSIKLYQQE